MSAESFPGDTPAITSPHSTHIDRAMQTDVSATLPIDCASLSDLQNIMDEPLQVSVAHHSGATTPQPVTGLTDTDTSQSPHNNAQTTLNAERIDAQFYVDGTYVGIEVLQKFSEVIYGSRFTGQPAHLHYMDTTLKLRQNDASLIFLSYVRCLVAFLEQGGADKPVKELINSLRKVPGWEGWKSNNMSENAERDEVWYMLYQMIGFAMWIPSKGASTFRRQMLQLFPPQPPTRTPATFNVTLSDILGVELVIRPTSFLHEHLQLDNNVVKVFRLTDTDLHVFHHYAENKIVQYLELQDLPLEIYASLHALYGKDQLFDEAKSLGLLELNDLSLILSKVSLDLNSQVPPKLFAQRAYTLEKVINYRRSFFPSLMRDIRKQNEKQPFVFYGALLAVFFGTCSVIQTVTSIWSLALTISTS